MPQDKASAEKAPAFQWYPRDFASDEAVRLMSYEQQGIYRQLLDHQWLEGSIPADETELAALLRIPLAKFRKLWPRIAVKFKAIDGGRLQNGRLERQRGSRTTFTSESAAEAGRRSAEVRRQKLGTAQPPNGHRADSFGELSERPFEEEPNASTSSSSSTATSSAESEELRAPAPPAFPRNQERFGPSIIGRNPHLNCAACGPGLLWCVPSAVHRKLAELLAPKHLGNRESAKAELSAWYPRVWQSLEPGFVMGDAFRFWQGRFDAELATPVARPAPAAPPPGPAAPRGCEHSPRCASAAEHTSRLAADRRAAVQ